MAGTKRKAPATKIAPSKAAKTSSATSPSRRSAKNSNPKESAIPAATESNSATHTLEEQPLFPRGGGSVLTPLEYKQIRIQAKKDVLFEEANGTATAEKDKKQSRKRKRKSAGKLAELDTHTRDSNSVKIESLSFKRLAKGTLVLGQVVDIRPNGLTLALPNNITGHVALTAISESLLKRIEAEAERDNPDESEDGDSVNLDSIFYPGQYLRAYVVSTVEDSSPDIAKTKKRIELSIRPEHSNSGLNAEDVVQNVTIMASVHSVEDHGYEMDLGYDQAKLRGFLPKKEMDKSRSKDLELGATLLCIVNSKNSSGRVIQLSTKPEKLCNIKYFPTTAPTIDVFLPGTAVDVLVSEATGGGIVGKIVGHLDATADVIHSGSGVGNNPESKYKAGSKFKARVTYTFPAADKPKVGISVLPHIASLKTHHISPEDDNTEHGNPLEKLPISSVVEECTIRKVEAGVGLFVDLGHDLTGFVHISRVKDGKVDALYGSSGPYKVDTVHRGRVIGYSAFDSIFQVTFQPSILEQKYLRLEDVPVGEVVNCVIEKLLLNKDGTALIVKLEEGIKGLVNNLHISDVALQNPEKKFKEGMKVRARVLEKDIAEKRLRLTLKKTLVNSDLEPITSYEKAVPGTKANGTIVKSLDHGAIVQFYGSVKGYLPQSEMSEAHIADHKTHFRIGQVLTVHVVDVDPENERLTVSCKDPSSFGFDKAMALKNLKIGTLVSGKVTEKTEDDVSLELSDSGLKAILPVGHLTDKSVNKSQAALKRIRTGQTLSELVVLDKNEKQRFVTVTQKPSLIKASQASALISTFDDATVGNIVSGFVRNVTVTAAFVEFAGGFTALLPKTNLPEEAQKEPDFGLRKFQPLSVKITSADPQTQRIIVAMPSATVPTAKDATTDAANSAKVENAVDDGVTCMADLSVGKIIKAKVVSVKNTQVNVRIADNIQGRIDASQVFDSWDDIADPKKPLKSFKRNDICDVKVLGVHDARNHKFLPFSHRSVHQVVELSAKPSDLKKEGANTLSIENIEVGSTWVAFVNNISNGLWVNIAPNIRGRIDPLNISDDVVQLNNLPSNFPVGTALRTRVLAVDPKNSRLDLTARSVDTRKEIDWDSIEQNMVLPGRILSVKPDKYQVIVRLSDKVVGTVSRLDMVDNYDEADPRKYKQGELVRVAVVSIDKHNQKLRLSMRPSRVLNSALKVRDREITDASQLSSGDIVRGIVKSISDKGLFVTLGGSVVGMVKIKDLSDKFLKSWKDEFKLYQLVKGRVLSVDAERGHVQLSLRPSVLDSNYKPVITYNDLKEGQVITGKVRKVQEFGAFIVVDNSANVSGLAHRSEMADQLVPDAREIYNEGDVVKAIVLEIDAEKKRMNLGLKPSYFEGKDSDEEMEDMDDVSETEDKGAMDTKDDDSNIEITGIDGPGLHQDESESEDDDEVEGEDDATDPSSEVGLETGGFDWNANMNDASGTESEEDNLSIPKKKRRKTKTVDSSVPAAVGDSLQRASDFDRLLLSHPDDSSLWIQYMAFQIQAGELAKAREIAERATQTINVREQTERMNVWIAYLNIEVEYGTEESLQEVFTRACQYNDEKDMHERLVSIYIKAGKHEAADELFQRLLKKFGADSVDVWVNYAHFLFTSLNSPDRARELLPRATQRLGKEAMIPLTCKFAALEYRCESGLAERGYTLFEGVLTQFPKRMDIWNQLADLEIAAGSDVVRSVFERGTQVKGLKPLAAQKWFAKWQEWELKNGDGEKGKERVMAKAQEWVDQRKSGQNK